MKQSNIMSKLGIEGWRLSYSDKDILKKYKNITINCEIIKNHSSSPKTRQGFPISPITWNILL